MKDIDKISYDDDMDLERQFFRRFQFLIDEYKRSKNVSADGDLRARINSELRNILRGAFVLGLRGAFVLGKKRVILDYENDIKNIIE